MNWNNIKDKIAGIAAGKKENKWVFRTNIMCNGCIAKVKPVLDNAEGIASWSVDLKSPDRLLTVVPDGIDRDHLMQLVRNAGFNIDPCWHLRLERG